MSETTDALFSALYTQMTAISDMAQNLDSFVMEAALQESLMAIAQNLRRLQNALETGHS